MGRLLGRIPILLTYGRTGLSVPTELLERGDTASISGLGRDGTAKTFPDGSLTSGEDGGETVESSFIPSFQAGGEGT